MANDHSVNSVCSSSPVVGLINSPCDPAIFCVTLTCALPSVYNRLSSIVKISVFSSTASGFFPIYDYMLCTLVSLVQLMQQFRFVGKTRIPMVTCSTLITSTTQVSDCSCTKRA